MVYYYRRSEQATDGYLEGTREMEERECGTHVFGGDGGGGEGGEIRDNLGVENAPSLQCLSFATIHIWCGANEN